jgi:undecaprenyl-diphosphatase
VGLESDLMAKSSASTAALVGGTMSSVLVGYLALIYLLKIVKKGKFYLFSPYCWVVGALALIFSFL